MVTKCFTQTQAQRSYRHGQRLLPSKWRNVQQHIGEKPMYWMARKQMGGIRQYDDHS